VAGGILASRVFGLVLQRVVAHYLGQSTAPADAFAAAFRIPNLLQNLFGEGVLSASFIPEYTRLVARGEHAEARQVAGAVAGLLAVIVTIVAGLGVLAAPTLVDVLVPGFAGERRTLVIGLVRILFPGVALLVLSAWCLGILNSHRRFFLSYAAPVIWNLAIIGATLFAGFGGRPADDIVRWAVTGALVGSVLQLAVQLPVALRLLGGLRLTLDTANRHVRAVLGNFAPVFVSRGVVQISGYLDSIIASWLPLGAVAALTNAQLLYTLPISLFGMSVAAAELPELSEQAGRDGGAGHALRDRLGRGARQVAFFVVPAAVGFLTLGHLVAGVVFQSGAFTRADALWVWGTLAGATIGLVPQSLGRLLTSAHYALADTRSPLRFAGLRVGFGLAFGLPAALFVPDLIGVDPKWGTAGLALGTALAASIEYQLLRRSLVRRVGSWRAPLDYWMKLWGSAALSAAVGWSLALLLGAAPPLITGLIVILVFAAVYFATTRWLGVPEAGMLRARLGRNR
jgi:putative peptidoglycan lipid II flippase